MRFLIAGGANTVATYAIYLALLYFTDPYRSYAGGFVSGIFISYFLNLKFTFCSAHSAMKIASYPLVYGAQFLLGILALHFCLKAGVSEEFAPFFAIAASVPFTFFMSRRVIAGEKKSANPVMLLSIAAFAVSVAAAYGALFAGDLFPHGILFNSDLSTPYVMWRDIFLEEGSFKEWNFKRVAAPYILTDLPFMWALYSITGGSLAAGSHLYAIIVFAASATGWMAVSGFVFGKKSARHPLVFVLFALMCVVLSYGSPDLFGIVFLPFAHFSTWAFVPFCVLIFLSAMRSESFAAGTVFSFLLAAIVCAVVYSDPIFTVWFLVPAFAAGALCLLLTRNGKLIYPLTALAAGFVCVRFVKKLFVEPEAVTVQYKGFGTPDAIALSLRDMLTWTTEAAARHPVLAVVWTVFFVVLLYAVVKSLFRFGDNCKEGWSDILFVRLILIISSAASVASPVLTGIFAIDSLPESVAANKYFVPAVFIPLFAGWAFLPNLPGGFLKRIPAVSFSGFIAAVSVFVIAVAAPNAFKLKENASAFAQYYPPVAECFDTNASKFGLRRGIASYWWAKSIMATSKTGVRIGHVSVYPDKSGRAGLYKWSFQISDRFYKGPIDFVITNKGRLRPDQDPCLGKGPGVCRHFGSKVDPISTYILRPEHAVYSFGRTPSATFSCGEAQVLVFKPLV